MWKGDCQKLVSLHYSFPYHNFLVYCLMDYSVGSLQELSEPVRADKSSTSYNTSAKI